MGRGALRSRLDRTRRRALGNGLMRVKPSYLFAAGMYLSEEAVQAAKRRFRL